MLNFSLIVCTYMRPKALKTLLSSVKRQTLYPNDIIIVDGSLDSKTEAMLNEFTVDHLRYIKVSKEDRGLTKQRNIGIKNLKDSCEIVCFLDDDTVLHSAYFEHLINTYTIHQDAIGVGGYIANEVQWQKNNSKTNNPKTFQIDGYQRKEGSRFILRKKLGLVTNDSPGYMPLYSHGRSVGFLPPSGKIYPVEFFMGGVASYRKHVFSQIHFSEYFDGYGLYEDLEFCLRLSKLGTLYVNTNAYLGHYHEASGRPNQYKYGKMVITNGWYVWRTKYPRPTLNSRVKWNATVFLLILARAYNLLTSKEKYKILTEVLGRFMGWVKLIFVRPKLG